MSFKYVFEDCMERSLLSILSSFSCYIILKEKVSNSISGCDISSNEWRKRMKAYLVDVTVKLP
jgi:hypothetical protein